MLGRYVHKRSGDTTWLPSALLTSFAIVAGFSYFILTGSIATIWPMFGIANQLLALVALVVGTTVLLRDVKKLRYALTTFLPAVFVGSTTLFAGVRALVEIYLPMARVDATATIGRVCTSVTAILIACVTVILIVAFREWTKIIALRRAERSVVA
jgi:carbon starvation protein